MPVNLQQDRGAVGVSTVVSTITIYKTVSSIKSLMSFFCLFCNTYKFLHVSVGHKFLFDCRFQEEY